MSFVRRLKRNGTLFVPPKVKTVKNHGDDFLLLASSRPLRSFQTTFVRYSLLVIHRCKSRSAFGNNATFVTMKEKPTRIFLFAHRKQTNSGAAQVKKVIFNDNAERDHMKSTD